MMRVLDLFCGAGGAAMGLHQAWPDAEIVGVDIKPQPRYPFNFIQADAIEYLRFGDIMAPWAPHESDFIWASPPCQAYSSMKPFSKRWGKVHADLVAPTREALAASGVSAWVIENVRGAPLLHAFMLCGLSFGLKTYRHRFFETKFMALGPSHIQHDPNAIRERRIFSCVGHPGGRSARDNLHFGNTQDWKDAMEMQWANGKEIAQAIPPAYSRYIAEQFSRARGHASEICE